MHSEILVLDGFYDKPDEIRAIALSDDYSVTGNYPGKRTMPNLEVVSGLRTHVESIMSATISIFTAEYNGAYQYCVESDRTWVHADTNNLWSGVVFLSPDPPLNSGTVFYKNKETGKRYWDTKDGPFSEDVGNDLDKWVETDYVANVYNRCVFWRGNLWHSAKTPYFGKSLKDARLFQTFFFDV